jgi:hypothetical protein
MKTNLMAAFVIGMLTLTTSGFSQTRIDQRQQHQHARIHEGKKDGEVTRCEAVALHKEQKRIQRSEHIAKADGHISRKEKLRLERQQDRANKHIYRAKNNAIER